MLMMLGLLFEGDASAASHAYKKTLQPYHGTMTSWAFWALLAAMPSREGILSIEALCPGATKAQREERLSQDVLRSAQCMLPLVQRMQVICKELGAWTEEKA